MTTLEIHSTLEDDNFPDGTGILSSRRSSGHSDCDPFMAEPGANQ